MLFLHSPYKVTLECLSCDDKCYTSGLGPKSCDSFGVASVGNSRKHNLTVGGAQCTQPAFTKLLLSLETHLGKGTLRIHYVSEAISQGIHHMVNRFSKEKLDKDKSWKIFHPLFIKDFQAYSQSNWCFTLLKKLLYPLRYTFLISLIKK